MCRVLRMGASLCAVISTGLDSLRTLCLQFLPLLGGWFRRCLLFSLVGYYLGQPLVYVLSLRDVIVAGIYGFMKGGYLLSQVCDNGQQRINLALVLLTLKAVHLVLRLERGDYFL